MGININLYQEVLSKASIVDVFNYYGLKLNHNKCLCPFHGDHNPSMVVKPKANIATCFSCQTTGNTISFVQKYEKQINNNILTTSECIRKVAEICNLDVDLSKLSKKSYDNKYNLSTRKYNDREKELLKTNEFLAQLFHYNLIALHKDVQKYLEDRKVDKNLIDDLNLGFIEKEQLIKLAQSNSKIKREDLIELGYIKLDYNGNIYVPLADRVSFPIQDERGNIVSFSGRAINGEQPKYLHTSENSIFKKSELLYNYSNARPLIYNTELILVEGFFDVVGAKRLGFENVAATMGVAITPAHLKLIKKNHSSITLALDNDKAGHDAMIKQIPELINQGFKVNVIDISKIGEYKDFGDLSEANIEFMEIQKAKVSGFTFLLDHKYFNDLDINVENSSLVYKQLKKDRLILNTYDESLFKEYIFNKTNYSMKEIDNILYPKKIEQSETAIGNFTFKAMINYLYNEVLKELEQQDDKVLLYYFKNNKNNIQRKLVDIFNNDPSKYLNSESFELNKKELLNAFLTDNKEYSEYEKLNKFKYLNVFEKTYIEENDSNTKVNLNEIQIQKVINQYENSLTDKDKLALEEVEELYIINSIDDVDKILSYENKTLDIIRENIKERLFLNKNKMDFFKFGSLFFNVDKEFIDDRFKGSTGNFKTILFYNNLDGNLTIDENNKNNKSVVNIVNSNEEKELLEEYLFSANKMLLNDQYETESHYFVRIPNTGAKEYFYIPKEECKWNDNHELFYTKLRSDEEYKIYNKYGKYLYDKSFYDLKKKWEEKDTKSSDIQNKDEEEEKESDSEILYDNTFTSKYKTPISKIYKSKIHLETEKGFYIKTNNPKILIFATKKICSWTDDKSYLIVNPRKMLFNTGISKYTLEGFKKTFEKKLSYSEIEKYIKIFYPNDMKKKEEITIVIPKYKCRINSNFVEVPFIVNDLNGYLTLNIIKTKIDKENITIELQKDDQIGFHDTSGNFISVLNGVEIENLYNKNKDNVIDISSIDRDSILMEKEAA